ncbi:AAA family ATPase [Myxococcus xanthus]|uniref:AAA family ATPase n=1 Tax=Myxococcus xanthus TaxID=34 RepID=UPI001916ED51|nr:ATP-binding protein [Myxococcus xanthus]QQR42447.1 AAA family ATPase [Myxococcus xanthus]
MSSSSQDLFDQAISLPSPDIEARTTRLIGFEARYNQVEKDIRLMTNPDALTAWSKQHYTKILPICEILLDRYPLIILEGDVGTGKTATAEGIASRFAKEHRKEAMLYKMSTRVRGTGLHGEMSKLVGEAFQLVTTEAGRKRFAFLLIDEADALASSRDMVQSHQEEKAGTNTLIQKLDEARKLGGRLVVLMCTNRISAVDPAIHRRAARILSFNRPTEGERLELLRNDLQGVQLTKSQLSELVQATGPTESRPYGMTFSDLRTRFLPTALLAAFPEDPLTFELLLKAACATPPSPPFPNT